MPLFLLAKRAILGEGDPSSSANYFSAILSLLFSRNHRSRVRRGIVLTNGWADPGGVYCADSSVLQNMRDRLEFRPETSMECRHGTRHCHYRGLLLDRERLDRDRFSNRLAHSLADLLDIQPPKTCPLRSPVQQAVHRCQSIASCLCRSTSTAKPVNLMKTDFAGCPASRF